MVRILAVFIFVSALCSNAISSSVYYASAVNHLSSHYSEAEAHHHHHSATENEDHVHHEDEDSEDSSHNEHTAEHRYELASLMLVLCEIQLVKSAGLINSYSYIERPHFYQFSYISAPSSSLFRPPIV